MGGFLSIPILALAAILQSTITPQIQILGGSPDLVLLLVLGWSIHAPLEENVTWALAGGVMQDLLSAVPVGTSALGMILLVFAIDRLKRQVYRMGFLFLIGLLLGGTLLKEAAQIIVLLIAGHRISLTAIAYVVLPTVAYNLLLFWPIYWFVRRVQRRIGEMS